MFTKSSAILLTLCVAVIFSFPLFIFASEPAQPIQIHTTDRSASKIESSQPQVFDDVLQSTSNQICENAESIVGVGVFPFDNRDDTACDPPGTNSCGRMQYDEWYCWTSTCNGTVTVDTCGTTVVDTMLAIYKDCDCVSTIDRFVIENDDTCNYQSEVEFQALAGENFLIQLGVGYHTGVIGGIGDFTITCNEQTSPCDQPGSHCQSPDQKDARPSDGITYTLAEDFTPANGGEVTQLCWWGTYYDGVLDCRDGSTDDFEVRYYANNNGVPGELIAGPYIQSTGTLNVSDPFRTQQRVMNDLNEYEYHATHEPVVVQEYTCYWVEITNPLSTSCQWYWQTSSWGNDRSIQDGSDNNFIDGYGIDDLTIDDLAVCVDIPLTLTEGCTSAPPNDNCPNALQIFDTQTPFTTYRATTDGPIELSCSFAAACCDFPLGDQQTYNDIWYDYTADCTGMLTVDVCDSDFDTKLHVYEGTDCTGSFDIAACNDDACGQELPFQSQVTIPVIEGQAYKIRIGSTNILEGRQSDCYQVRTTAGCNDIACESAVCENDPACCDNVWDERCATHALTYCGEACYGINIFNNPNCLDPSCETKVCDIIPECCSNRWGSGCVELAYEVCIGTQGNGTLSVNCIDAADATGCENTGAQYLPYMFTGNHKNAFHECSLYPGSHTWVAFELCEASSVTLDYSGTLPAFQNVWDTLSTDCTCTRQSPNAQFEYMDQHSYRLVWSKLKPGVYYYPVSADIGSLGDYQISVTSGKPISICEGFAGNCCLKGDLPGCGDLSCCEAVCKLDPLCCETGWDGVCAREAIQICASCPGSGCEFAAGDCNEAHETPGCNDQELCELICSCDPYCCDVSWDEYCAGDGLHAGCGAANDCNDDGTPDIIEISTGISADCNDNGLPDICEPDCNNNLVADECDLLGCHSIDCNNNEIPDDCDIADDFSSDCNNNFIPDECDIASGHSLDCNANLSPDDCDITNEISADCNNNSLPDDCEIIPPAFQNTGGENFLLSHATLWRADDIILEPLDCYMIAYEIAVSGVNTDTQEILLVRFQYELIDNDFETGVIPGTKKTTAIHGNTIQRHRFIVNPPVNLPDKFYIIFKVDGGDSGAIFTRQQPSRGYTNEKYYDHYNGTWRVQGLSQQFQGGIDLTIWCSGESDCNDNGVPDECDLDFLTSDDCNNNAHPDECELGDFNGDFIVDDLDMTAIVQCFTLPCSELSCDPPLYMNPCCEILDFDHDGDLDMRDFAEYQNLYLQKYCKVSNECDDADECTFDRCGAGRCLNIIIDTDGDKVGDCYDDCPEDPNKTEPGACGCGQIDHDFDADLIANCVDNCIQTFNPDQANSDADQFGDACDNCPDLPDDNQADNDRDGIGNVCDNCPSHSNADQANADSDNWGDVCDNCLNIANEDQANNDGDSAGNACDECPNDPTKIILGDCECGVADIDSDSDGWLDCNDGCPNDANKIEPGVCGCGITDDDSDLDGTYDCNDGCPNDENKIEPGACGCGQLETDSDNDSVPDCIDDCPDTPPGTNVGGSGCAQPPTTWESSRTLSFYQISPDNYNFATDGQLTHAEIDWDTNSLAINFSGNVISTVSEIPLDVETTVFELDNVFGLGSSAFVNRKITIDIFTFEVVGNTATWTFDYTIVDTIDILSSIDLSSTRFNGWMTGTTSGSQNVMTFTELYGEQTDCDPLCSTFSMNPVILVLSSGIKCHKLPPRFMIIFYELLTI